MSNQQLLEHQSPVEFLSTSPSTPAFDDDAYPAVHIPDEVWATRLQDTGCTKAMMPAKVYQRAKIPPIEPKDNETYYYQLTSTAIDIIGNMKLESDLGWG